MVKCDVLMTMMVMMNLVVGGGGAVERAGGGARPDLEPEIHRISGCINTISNTRDATS